MTIEEAQDLHREMTETFSADQLNAYHAIVRLLAEILVQLAEISAQLEK